MADFATRQAPVGATSTTWNDGEGSHEIKIKDGLFTPKNASEEVHAVTLGWPVAGAAKPSRPRRSSKPRAAAKPKSQPQQAPAFEPVAPAAGGEETA